MSDEYDESDLKSLMTEEGLLSRAEATFCLRMARQKQPERKNSNTTVWQAPQYSSWYVQFRILGFLCLLRWLLGILCVAKHCRSCKTMKQAQKGLEEEKWKEADCGKPADKPVVRHRVKSGPRVSMRTALKGKDPKGQDQEQHATASKSRTSRPSEAASASSHNAEHKKDTNEGDVKTRKRTACSKMDAAKQHEEQEAEEKNAKKEKKEKKDRKHEKSSKEKQEKHKNAEKSDKKQKKDKKATKDDVKLQRKVAHEDLMECLKEFEDSEEEPAPPEKKSRIKREQSPEIDEEEIEQEYYKWRWGENYWQEDWTYWQEPAEEEQEHAGPTEAEKKKQEADEGEISPVPEDSAVTGEACPDSAPPSKPATLKHAQLALTQFPATIHARRTPSCQLCQKAGTSITSKTIMGFWKPHQNS